MKQITNPRISSLEPRWAPYRGFSLLFDNPGPGYTSTEEGLIRLDCHPKDDLRLYNGIYTFLHQIDVYQLREEFLFCPLPFYSHHVTVWDGLNDGNIQHLPDNDRIKVEDYLENMPDLLLSPNEFTLEAYRSPLVQKDWKLKLICTALEKWSNISLVALLSPDDDQSQKAFDEVVSYRKQLNESYRKAFGINMRASYSPHVTLGYFANQDLAKRATPRVEEWEAKLQEVVRGLKITFSRISLYGFEDMVTFLKKS